MARLIALCASSQSDAHTVPQRGRALSATGDEAWAGGPAPGGCLDGARGGSERGDDHHRQAQDGGPGGNAVGPVREALGGRR